MNNKITFRIPTYWMSTIRLMAREKGVKMSVIVRWALRDYLFPRR